MDEASLLSFFGAEFGYVSDGSSIRLSVEGVVNVARRNRPAGECW
jgi:hypothetical protein